MCPSSSICSTYYRFPSIWIYTVSTVGCNWSLLGWCTRNFLSEEFHSTLDARPLSLPGARCHVWTQSIDCNAFMHRATRLQMRRTRTVIWRANRVTRQLWRNISSLLGDLIFVKKFFLKLRRVNDEYIIKRVGSTIESNYCTRLIDRSVL